MEQSRLRNTGLLNDLDVKIQQTTSLEFSEPERDQESDALLGSTYEFSEVLEESEKSFCPYPLDADVYTRDQAIPVSDHPRSQTKHQQRAKACIVAFGSICWLLLLVLYFVQPNYRQSTAKPANLDVAYQATQDFDIVISMYREDPNAVSGILKEIIATLASSTSYRVLIYTKNEEWKEPEMRADFPDAEIIHRPNIGREGETYLYHILSRWDDLARHTLFTQAYPDNFEELLFRMKQHLVPETGMMGLSFVSEICDCHLCQGPFWHDYSGVLAKTYELANKRPCDWLLLSYKGQFIASAARIRGAGQEVYRYLEDALVEEDSWAHQPEYWTGLGLGTDSMNAPILGFTLERLWFAIMQCSNMKVPAHCHTMISTNTTPSNVTADDCQCFDHEPGVNYIGS